jgi:hypothetical protein
MHLNTNLPRDLINYQHGYCYIFAIALAHVLDKGITVVWDTDATDDDLEPIYEDCLVHAFVTKDNVSAFDAVGRNECLETLVDEFPCNTEKREVISITRMYRIIKQKEWEVPSEIEINCLIEFIQHNKVYHNE